MTSAARHRKKQFRLKVAKRPVKNKPKPNPHALPNRLEELSVRQCEEINAELDELLRERFVGDANPDHWFYVHLQGGPWTAANLKVISDGMCAYARGGLPTAWCITFSYSRQVRLLCNL